jgi:hypothetical protein
MVRSAAPSDTNEGSASRTMLAASMNRLDGEGDALAPADAERDDAAL